MKNVFVSGGDKGIGKAIIQKMASLGHCVIFTYNKNIKGAIEIKKKYDYTSFYQCNIQDFKSVNLTIKEILTKHNSIDILINNLGTNIDRPFIKMDWKTWSEVIDINLKSCYHFSQAFIPHMINNQWGRIINTSSLTAFKGYYGISNYSASKAGIVGFTKSLAIELAKFQITVNAIAPGMINTDMFRSIKKVYRDEMIKAIPLKRIGSPQEVANLVSVLASDDASYITGQTIHINGGLVLM